MFLACLLEIVCASDLTHIPGIDLHDYMHVQCEGGVNEIGLKSTLSVHVIMIHELYKLIFPFLAQVRQKRVLGRFMCLI